MTTCPNCGNQIIDGMHVVDGLGYLTAITPWSSEDAIDILGIVAPEGQSTILIERSAGWAVPVRDQPGYPFERVATPARDVIRDALMGTLS